MGVSNQILDKILQSKKEGEDLTSHLTSLANDYPYFAPVQFYLLKQLHQQKAETSHQSSKTALLFNNAYWLQFQLSELDETVQEQSFTSNVVPVEVPIATDFLSDDDRESFAELEKEIQEEQAYAGSTEQNEFKNENDEELGDIVPSEEEASLVEEAPINIKHVEEILEKTTPEEPIKHEEPVAHSFEEEHVSEAIEEPAVEEKIAAAAPVETAPVIVEEIKEPAAAYSDEEDPLPDEELTDEEKASILPLKLNLRHEPLKHDEGLSFEPLHTTDYFASLGIKLSNEMPTDKLGRQMKSFTDWLKTMKKIHTEQLTEVTAQNDISIQKLAEKSNNNETVLTEAMADVLLQQGKVGKAVEVYKKLSLIYPAKSAYFAAKIEKLNED